MSDQVPIATRRAGLLRRLFPDGAPTLWCPALTHYDAGGGIDGARMAAHLRHQSAAVKGFLIPGSTGDGWELNDAETKQLLGIALDQAEKLDLRVLIGALRTDARSALRMIHDTVDWIKARANESDPAVALARAGVCGFTVCPPRGKELSQAEIRRALESLLQTGLPLAIYQLPQITQNEIGAELAADLAGHYENFILFKDTSGADRVVLSGSNLSGVFALRGAEGDYARWLNTAGGPYQGFLLSSANVFARELRRIISDLSAGQLEAARALSDRLSIAVREVFEAVGNLPDGNPFANANKAIDHFFAFGPRAAEAKPPRLHAGSCLPLEVIRSTGEILQRHGLMPDRGYLDCG